MTRPHSSGAFRFRLESIRRLREWEKQRCSIALARRISRVSSLRNHLRELMSVRDQEWEQMQVGGGALDPTARSLYSAYTRRTFAEMASCRLEISDAEREVEAARRDWGKAEQRLTLLDKLREREMRAFEQDTARREQAALDEVAARPHASLAHARPGKGVGHI